MTQTASLYARLSVAADDANMSRDGMVDDLKDLARKLGADPKYVHVDDGKTGGRRDRDEFKEWLADATEGRAQILLNPYTDRLTREGLNVAASVLDVVEGKDPATGRVVSRPVRLVDLQGLDSEHGDAFRLRFVLQAEVARAERERMRARQRASQKRLIAAGRVRGGPAPYGYRIAKSEEHAGYTYVLHEEEAAFIKEAVRRLLQGDSVGRIARWANHKGIAPRRAKQWQSATLRKTLAGNAITGRVTSKGNLVRDAKGEPLQPFPAIISVAEHAAVLEKVAPVLPKKTPAPKRLYLLSGILHCYSCGRPMRVGGNRENLNYRCGARSEGQLCNSGVAASTRRIEKAITDLFLSRYGAERMYRERTVVEGVDDLAEINEEIKDVMRELSSAVSPEAVERLQRLQEKRSEAEARPPVKRTFREPTGESVALWWESAHLDDRRDALRNAYGRITLHPGRPGAHGFDVRRLTFERSTEEE